MGNKVSRRDFLKLVITSIGAFLASCMPRINQAPAPTLTVTSSRTPESTSTATTTQTPTSTPTATSTEIFCFHLLTPENGAKLNVIGKVIFSWEVMSGAARYKLEITLPTGQIISFDTNGVSRNQYIEAIKIGGVFQWRVIAFGTNGEAICTSEPYTFEKPEYIPPAPTKESSGGGDSIPLPPPPPAGGSSNGH